MPPLPEPDPSKHHIFSTFTEAQMFWDALSDDAKLIIAFPRQAHGWTWIVDRLPTEMT